MKLFVWLLLAPGLLRALDPGVAISQYAKRHWQVEDGLPQNYITSIAQTPDGYLLIGTAGGAARFDGLRFTPLVLDAKTGVSREWITAVAASADGQVWLASRDAGAYLFSRQALAPLRHFPFRFDALRPGVDSTVGLGPEGYRAWRSESSQPLCAELRTGNPSWQALTDGYIAAGGHLYRRSAGICTKALSLGAQVLAVAEGQQRTLWIGASDGLYRADAAMRVTRATRVEGVPGPVVYVLEDRDGVVWAATWGSGLFRVTSKGVDAWTSRQGLPDDFVHNLFEDREGNLWIGSRAGLSRWKSTPVIPYGIAEGLGGQFISTISGDNGGNIWIGSWRSGLHRFRNGRIAMEKLPLPELDVLIRAAASSPAGVLWISTWNELLEKTDSGWRRYARQAYSLAFDHDGAMWVGGADGLYHYPAGRPDDSPPVVKATNVGALLIDNKGTVWAGAQNGLWRIDGQAARAIHGLPHAAVASLTQDTAGRVWATTRANGISLLAASGVRTVDQRHGLPALPFYALLDDGRGALWLSSPAGIFSVASQQIVETLEGKRARIEAHFYGQDDGMRTIECQSVGFPSGWKEQDGSLWFPTVRGVVRIRPSSRRTLAPPAVVVESDEREARTHVIRFTAPRLSAAERIEFRYRMEGVNADWVAAGTERTLRFTSLPVGDHVVWIAAREPGGEWGAASRMLLHQPPRFHETWTFRLLCGAALCGLFYLFYRWRLFLLKGRYRAVIAERNRISREWHDTLLAGFSAISWQLDAALQRLRDKPESAANVVETARSMVQHYRAEARRVIWDLRSNEPELPGLESALAHSIAEMTSHANVESKVEVSGQPVALPGELAQNVLRICQEAVTNALQHGAPSRIRVRLQFAEDRLVAAIEDNGKGFDPSAIPAGHFGLAIVRERARRFGGEIEITTGAGQGTTVTASIPYPAGAA